MLAEAWVPGENAASILSRMHPGIAPQPPHLRGIAAGQWQALAPRDERAAKAGQHGALLVRPPRRRRQQLLQQRVKGAGQLRLPVGVQRQQG